jgi:hypothetical protein
LGSFSRRHTWDLRTYPSERFLQGSDLLKKDGVSPWRIHLINVFQSYPAVRRKLVEEQLISLDREAELESPLQPPLSALR